MIINDGLQEISMDGFQVVSKEMFGRPFRQSVPTATFWRNSVTFSKSSLTTLNNCERIRIEINTAKHLMLIVPVTENDKDGILWVSGGKDVTTRVMDCSVFASQIYDAWGWDKDYVYKAEGRLVTVNEKVMILYDFSKPDYWKCGKKKMGKRDE